MDDEKAFEIILWRLANWNHWRCENPKNYWNHTGDAVDCASHFAKGTKDKALREALYESVIRADRSLHCLYTAQDKANRDDNAVDCYGEPWDRSLA